MKKVKIVLSGFLLWLIPFLFSFLIYPLKTSGSPLFESLMPLILVLFVCIFSYLYLKDIESGILKEGIIIGVIWFLISIIIDLSIFLPSSPMQMSFNNYLSDIGITYLIFPIITISMAKLRHIDK